MRSNLTTTHWTSLVKKTIGVILGQMNPEEQSRPKGPKVEPIDRRGKLLSFKAQRAFASSHRAEVRVESPAQKLHRLKDDIAPDVKEIREIIAHYIPFIELVEIEQMLIGLIGPPGINGRTSGGLSEILREIAGHQILNGESLRLGDDVRALRNGLFHDCIELNTEQSAKINRFWNQIQSLSEAPSELAMEMKSLLSLGERDIEQAKPTLAKISPVAYLVEIEQALRKVRNHLVKHAGFAGQDRNLRSRHPDNGDAIVAIAGSTGSISHALEKLGFMKDLRYVVGLRNKVLHLQADIAQPTEDAAKIERVWSACQNLSRIIRIHRCIIRIENSLRTILRDNKPEDDKFEFWRIDRIIKKAAEDSVIRNQIEFSGITKAQLKIVETFLKNAGNEILSTPTSEQLTEFQEISSKLKLAEKPRNHLTPTNTLPKSKRQELLEQEARHPKKKPRKDYRQ
jgi:hypothetical protein